MRHFFKNNAWVIIITIILFLIPFFWLKPGEMDLGGDSTRLYYYDPLASLLHDGYYMVDNVLEGIRTIEPHYYNLPYVLLLLVIKTIIPSSYFLIAIINGVKLSLSFLFVFLIIRTILQHSYKAKKSIDLSLPSILGGLFYIVTPIMIGNYDKALTSQNQVFLNPLLFYLLLRYFLTTKFRFLVYAIIVSVLFTPNFAWAAAPPFFSFFPIAILFLFLYVKFVLKVRINVVQLLMGTVLLLGLHAFHIIPEIYNLLSPGSYVNARVFDKDNIISQLNYYYGILPLSKLSLNFLMHAPFKEIAWASIIPSIFVILGFVLNKSRNKIYLLSGIFFLATLFLLTANITNAGVKLYESFFYIPGFSMFRNFIGQWAFVFSFFYAILFGQSIYLVFQKIKKNVYRIALTSLISFLFVIGAWQFFNGNLVNKTHFQTKDVKIGMKMDPQYEKLLHHINSLDTSGSIISFPFTDCCYSVVHGTNNGAYVGQSSIKGLTGVKDYNGYLVISPFSEVFLKLAKEKDYQSIKRMIGLLDIDYIYYNADPKIYDEIFFGYPYSTVRTYLPKTQKEYKIFIEHIADKKVYQSGPYQLYKVDHQYDNAHFYAPKKLKIYENIQNDWYGKTFSFFLKDYTINSGYVEEEICNDIFSQKSCKKDVSFSSPSSVTYKKIDPTKYLVTVKGAKKGYVLVFSETFHKNWNVSVATDKKKLNEKQFLVNGYANAWYISPKDVNNKTDYTLVIEMSEQKVFYLSIFISGLTAGIALFIGVFFLFRK